MTNEEAIKQLKKCKSFHNGSYGAALNIAIKVLEQQQNIHDRCKQCVEFSEFEPQPCEDCISRKDALDVIEKEKQGWEGSERYAIDECHTRIAELPSVTPKAESEDKV